MYLLGVLTCLCTKLTYDTKLDYTDNDALHSSNTVLSLGVGDHPPQCSSTTATVLFIERACFNNAFYVNRGTEFTNISYVNTLHIICLLFGILNGLEDWTVKVV